MTDAERHRNDWRQGSLLSDAAQALCGLGTGSIAAQPHYAVVVSHDCDLAASDSKEPTVEIITALQVQKLGGDSYAKNARRLQVEYQSTQGPVVLELSAAAKIAVAKAALFAHAPRRDITLDKQGLNILQRWLAARYRRAAFPEAFEARLRAPQLSGGKSLLQRIGGILAVGGDHLRGLLYELDQGANVERVAENDMYMLGIVVLYNSLRDEYTAAKMASTAAEQLAQLFEEAFETPTGEWQGICLEYCLAMSDNALTVAESERYQQWRLEHLSLQSHPPQAMMSN